MYKFPYRKQLVWYIEARDRDGSPFACPDPDSLGTGVVVTLRSRKPGSSPRKYLLTCAHVVNKGIEGEHEEYDEIFCFRPGKGYSRTYPDSRKIGQHPGAFRSRIATAIDNADLRLCPPLEHGRRAAADDWVLLEIENPSFQKIKSTPRAWGSGLRFLRLTVYGYAGGAGFLESQFHGRDAYWETCDIVAPVSSRASYLRSEDTGLLSIEGNADTQPGMSGGAVLDILGRLIGIHRSAAPERLTKGAVSADSIRQWLVDHANMEPVYDWRPTLSTTATATSLAILGGVSGSYSIPIAWNCRLPLWLCFVSVGLGILAILARLHFARIEPRSRLSKSIARSAPLYGTGVVFLLSLGASSLLQTRGWHYIRFKTELTDPNELKFRDFQNPRRDGYLDFDQAESLAILGKSKGETVALVKAPIGKGTVFRQYQKGDEHMHETYWKSDFTILWSATFCRFYQAVPYWEESEPDDKASPQ